MPTSESFALPDEEQLVSDVYPFDFDPETRNDSSLMKNGFIDIRTGDGDASAMYDDYSFACDGFVQSSQIITSDKPPHTLSHRGSTSSSSSERSGSSNSLHTSIDATTTDASPSEWIDMDPPVDYSQFLTMSGGSSSPTPPVATEPPLEPTAPSETLPQERAPKRRKPQPRKPRMKKSSSQLTFVEISSVSGLGPSSEPSPNAMYTTFPSPNDNFSTMGDVFGSADMLTGWVTAANNQAGDPLFQPMGSDATRVSPANHDPQPGNLPTPANDGLPPNNNIGSLSHPPLPRLVIHPMPLKSRVETQIPLKITLHNLPKGIKRVHLPTHTIAKPKLLQKPPIGPSADMLEMSTLLVCSSAMNDEAKLRRALDCAAGEISINELNGLSNPADEDEKVGQKGGEVRICLGCVSRERKRASRKKHKKPEEEELWDRYQWERAIVFNTREVQEWQTVTAVMADPTGAGFINGALPEGTVQIDAPMRIACYCRHHAEKLGFQVIITLKDYIGNVVAQGISSSIMITDDHKTPTPQQPTQAQSEPHAQPPTTGPTTPINGGTEPFVFSGLNNRPMNMERAVNQMFSAPVSAHPSRAPSPSQLRPDAQNLQLSHLSQEMLSGPLTPPPAILRIIPNEGSKCGGAEITVLGSNFTNDGLEVYFGTQRAITTTYWGPTSLVCLLPPSPVSGPVPVMIRQPGRRQAMQQTAFFIYKDDDEDQLIRAALGVLASQYGGAMADPAGIARSILFAQSSASGSNNQDPHGNGNGNGNFNRFSLESGEAVESILLRILEAMDLNEGVDKARINLRQSSGQTMLHLACSLGFVRFVVGLLSRGANVHIKDKGGFTALHMAAMNDHPKIVRRLIAQGADRNVKSSSGLGPMDVARSSSVRRILQYVENNFRSRSVESHRARASRTSSPSPVRSLWEHSMPNPLYREDFRHGNLDTPTSVDDDYSDEETTADETHEWIDTRGGLTGLRRRSTVNSQAVDEEDAGPASPNATIAAIRDQFAYQLQQIQHTMAMHLQNLPQFQMPNIPQIPNLPPMPVLPGYQAYLQSAPVMQRISSFVPNIRGQRQESAGDQTSNPNDNKWTGFPFFGNKDAPPAYEEIFPQKDLDLKQSSAAQAATEFEADAKCATLYDQDPAEASQTQVGTHTEEVPALLQIGRKHLITKEQQETLQRAHAQRLKAGSSDKMLWFVWIPILVLVVGAMLWSGAPSLLSGTASVAKALTNFAANPRLYVTNRLRNIAQELA
ncbi:hypothetical protein NUW58_g2291 [Xylaria curta]|uniref:Uncharacterized protein n=1 Tax=Xylaria curta TaxID=42375 RepID=A0ACC1PHW8_9PEZI|nr:hypothetical protein NUW58_g2291 [Xylaria curta]